ncbi:hypothetical protein HDV01_004122 [Terramyces sp. JEL0728]|nr:hypothetical protein HDV01_004122 [Terramyces sp. JEL0728]
MGIYTCTDFCSPLQATVGTPVNISWTLDSIPSSNLLNLTLYQGNPLAETGDPCTVKYSNAVHSFSIAPNKSMSHVWANIAIPSSAITSQQIQSDNEFFFQLQNSVYKNCLIGPIYNSTRTAFKLCNLESNLATAEAGDASPTPQVDPTSTLPILYWLLVIFGIVFLLACAFMFWYAKRNTGKLAIIEKNESKQTESKVQSIVVVPETKEARATSLSEPIQLPRIPSVNSLDLHQSFEVNRASGEALLPEVLNENSIKEFLKDLDRPTTPSSGMIQRMSRDDAAAISNAFKDALSHPDWGEIEK